MKSLRTDCEGCSVCPCEAQNVNSTEARGGLCLKGFALLQELLSLHSFHLHFCVLSASHHCSAILLSVVTNSNAICHCYVPALHAVAHR